MARPRLLAARRPPLGALDASARGRARWRAHARQPRHARRRRRAGARPASTSSRSAASASSRERRAGAAAPTTSTISPRGGVLADMGGQLGGAAAADFLVQLGQLAADRHRALGVERRRAARASPRAAAATRTRRASPARRASRRSSSPRLRGRKPTKRQRSAGSPEATSAVTRRSAPAAPRPAARRRGTRARARSRGRRPAACRRRTPAPRPRPPRMRATSSRGARAFVVLVEADQRARRSRGARAARACGACPRRRSRRPRAARRARAASRPRRLPIGVGHTTSRPTARLRGSHRANIGSAPMAAEHRDHPPQYTRYRAPAAALLPATRAQAHRARPPGRDRRRRAAPARRRRAARRPRERRRRASAWRRWRRITPKRVAARRCSRSSSAGWLLSLVLFLLSSHFERTSPPADVAERARPGRLPADLGQQHPRARLRPAPEGQQGTGRRTPRARAARTRSC